MQRGQQDQGAEEGPRLQAQQARELLPEQRQREHDGEVAPMHGAQPGRAGRVGAADVRPETRHQCGRDGHQQYARVLHEGNQACIGAFGLTQQDHRIRRPGERPVDRGCARE